MTQQSKDINFNNLSLALYSITPSSLKLNFNKIIDQGNNDEY